RDMRSPQPRGVRCAYRTSSSRMMLRPTVVRRSARILRLQQYQSRYALDAVAQRHLPRWSSKRHSGPMNKRFRISIWVRVRVFPLRAGRNTKTRRRKASAILPSLRLVCPISTGTAPESIDLLLLSRRLEPNATSSARVVETRLEPPHNVSGYRES